MSWESERYDWSTLRGMGPASGVPTALAKLQAATSEEEATDAYWEIDNTVVVQGSLYEAALPTAACAVLALHPCTTVARPFLLELLAQLGMGSPDPSEIEAGNAQLQTQCVQQLSRGVAMYFEILRSGTEDERPWCVDLLGLCVRADASLRAQVLWHFERLLSESVSDGLRELVENWKLEF